MAEQCRRIGRNNRLDGLQAAVLLAKLLHPHFDRWLAIRHATAIHYSQGLPFLSVYRDPEAADAAQALIQQRRSQVTQILHGLIAVNNPKGKARRLPVRAIAPIQ